MEWLNNIYQNFEGLLSNLAQYIQSNPKVGHLIGIFLLSIWLIGLIFNWKWTYKGNGSYGWKSHSTLPLLATQNYPFWLKYD